MKSFSKFPSANVKLGKGDMSKTANTQKQQNFNSIFHVGFHHQHQNSSSMCRCLWRKSIQSYLSIPSTFLPWLIKNKKKAEKSRMWKKGFLVFFNTKKNFIFKQKFFVLLAVSGDIWSEVNLLLSDKIHQHFPRNITETIAMFSSVVVYASYRKQNIFSL